MVEWLSQLLADVIEKRIAEDKRTTDNTFLGWPKNQIFSDVIGAGQADFDSPVGHLSSYDRALLYAKYNQGRHLDELNHAFGLLLGENDRIYRPTIIDIGCGPFTAGLSFAASFGAHGPFRYFGVDRAASMLTLAAELASAAEKANAFHPLTSWNFKQELEHCDFGPARGEWTIVVASYLLASPTIDVAELVGSILATLERVGPGPVVVLYTNSAHAAARQKYPDFRRALESAGFEAKVDDVEYFTDTVKAPKRLHYALLYRPQKKVISMQGMS